MNAIVLVIIGLGAMTLGYRFYSKFIAEKIYRLDPHFETPAHAMRDDVDYVPTHRFVLWGHHFTAVAGAAPIVGPAVAMGDEEQAFGCAARGLRGEEVLEPEAIKLRRA